VTVTDRGSRDSLTTRLTAVVLRLSRIALDLHLLRLPTDAPNKIRLDSAIAVIDKTIRECQILAVRNLPTGEDGAGRRPGPHQAT
jgi:hypothetical protein